MIKYKKILLENQDEGYREFQIKLLPGVDNFMGVRMPILRKIAKEISSKNQEEYLSQKHFETYEEKMIFGIVVGNLELPFLRIEKYIWEYLSMVDNWGLCDSFCSSLKITQKYKEEMFNLIKKAALIEEEYYQRFASVMILNYFFDEKYTEDALNILEELKVDSYYTKMGVAWAISKGFLNEKEKVTLFLKDNKVDEWIKKKAIQKIRESRLVNKGELELLISEVYQYD